ncbi:MAG TPA: hypothetical protein VJZ00_13940 [Thermoanaerobaculia bacterium]|nr:hypothetical protein [Thermoanaerobaculia bacterium]
MRIRLTLLLLVLAFTAAAEERFSYVFNQGGRSTIRANGSIESAVRLAKKWSGDFIWVREDGREYLIRDANVLAEAKAAMAVLEPFERAVRTAEKKVQPYEDQLDEIERKSDDLSDKLGDDEDLSDSERESLEAKLRDVEEQMHDIEARMHGLEKELESAERDMDAREEEAEKNLEQVIRRAIRNGLASRAD